MPEPGPAACERGGVAFGLVVLQECAREVGSKWGSTLSVELVGANSGGEGEGVKMTSRGSGNEEEVVGQPEAGEGLR